ncbi:unnamed protein product [Protopolystoma xenopodis]|uniref:Uncharacterized protein n=1 Tax=Protopolystoma xenopodis TaxID=117903 RepID=A0A448XGW9_9PLAT|nr:unnamed protein product [Protopolystoma xenopodis]
MERTESVSEICIKTGFRSTATKSRIAGEENRIRLVGPLHGKPFSPRRRSLLSASFSSAKCREQWQGYRIRSHCL